MVGGRHNLACRGLTFVTLDGASRLLNALRNIAEVGQLMFPILVGRAPPFEETINWLQFVYTTESTGGYMVPAYTDSSRPRCRKETPSFPLSGRTSCAASWELTL